MQRQLGRYILGERIGGGGMAEVFAGYIEGAEGFVREVAIKRIRPDSGRSREFHRMFIREARLASLLVHPNIVSVLDFEKDADGNHFLVMERVHGVDLHGLMSTVTSTGPVAMSIAVFIVVEVLRGLAHAHELCHGSQPVGIVHRDVSPHNVMLARSGAVKLVDFGVARALSAAHPSILGSLESMPGIHGKVAYMSPEQVHGVELDGRADVFSAGILLYELLTSRRLFAAPTPVESVDLLLRKKIASPRALAPAVPHDLAAICLRMLARDRRERIASARDASRALEACALVPARPDAALAALLSERFPALAADPVADPPPLSEKSVPLVPSLVMKESADAAITEERTRTAPRPRSAVRAGERPAGRVWPRWPAAILILAGLLGLLAAVYRAGG